MIVDVLVNYAANLVPLGKRNSQSTKLRDVVPVSIAETGAAEAPVVAWWSPPGCAAGDQVALRHFDGRLYAPLAVDASDVTHGRAAAKGTKDPDSCRKASRPGANGSLPLVSGKDVGSLLATGDIGFSGTTVKRGGFDADLPTLDQVPHRKVESSNRDVVRAEAARVASDLLIVGGIAYRAIPEPVLRVDADHFGVQVVSDCSEQGYKSLGLAYRLDQWTEAKATWRAILEREGKWEKGWEKERNVSHYHKSVTPPEVLRPDLLKIDPRTLAVRHVAKDVVSRLSMPDHGGWSRNRGHARVMAYTRDVALSFARLRDAVAEGRPADDLLERLSELGESVRPHGTLSEVHKTITRLGERIERESDHDALSEIGAPRCA